jgi:hypothetical protein
MSGRPDDHQYLRRLFAKYEGRSDSLRRLLAADRDRDTQIRKLREHISKLPKMLEESGEVLLDMAGKADSAMELESRLVAILNEISRQSVN